MQVYNAAKEGNFTEVQRLVAMKANINWGDSPHTPLFF